MRERKRTLTVLMLLLALNLSACGTQKQTTGVEVNSEETSLETDESTQGESTQPDQEMPVLTATISYWSEMGGDDAKPKDLVGLTKGDVIFEGMGYKLTVKSISKDKIVLKSSGGIIEKEESGGINMNKLAPKKLVIKMGEEKHYATQSMDGGVNFTFSYTNKVPVIEAEKTPLEKILDGDKSVLDESQESWPVPDFKNDKFTYEYLFMDLDGDGQDEMLVQMEDEPQGFMAIFHQKDDKVACWMLDDLEMTCFDYPLDDGSMVEEYDYGGAISYHIYRYNSDGEKEYLTELFIREEVGNDETVECPDYRIDVYKATKEEFEAKRKELILDHTIDASAWTKIQ